MQKIKLIPLLFLLFSYNAFSASPYKFDDGTEATLGTVVSVIGIGYSITNSDFNGLSTYQIDNLMDEELLGINRIAVNNYNDNLALVSDFLLGACVAVPVLQIFDGRVKEDWGIYGLMYLENAALSLGTTTIAKNIFRETRPYVYNPDVPLEMKLTKDARQSFFSGHACLAFASMTFFAETYGKYYPDNSNHNLIWLGSMTLAGTTAILRVFSGRHFPIDILVGSVVGFAIGKLIPHIHENNDPLYYYPEIKSSKIFAVSLNL